MNNSLVGVAAAAGVVVRKAARDSHVHEHVRPDGDLADRIVHDHHRRLQKNVSVTFDHNIHFHFPIYPLYSCQTFLASHFHTNWLSQLGLGNQVGSTTNHL